MRYAKNSYPFIGGIIMFINYKKLYENLVNKIEGLWNDLKFKFSIVKIKDFNEFFEGYFDTLSDFYVDYLSKYKVHDKMNNIKIINYRERYLDIVEYIKNLHLKAMEESKIYGPYNNYINGFLDCTRDLLAITY